MTDRPFQSAIAGKRPDLGSRAGFAASSVYRPPTYRECISRGGWLISKEIGRFPAYRLISGDGREPSHRGGRQEGEAPPAVSRGEPRRRPPPLETEMKKSSRPTAMAAPRTMADVDAMLPGLGYTELSEANVRAAIRKCRKAYKQPDLSKIRPTRRCSRRSGGPVGFPSSRPASRPSTNSRAGARTSGQRSCEQAAGLYQLPPSRSRPGTR